MLGNFLERRPGCGVKPGAGRGGGRVLGPVESVSLSAGSWVPAPPAAPGAPPDPAPPGPRPEPIRGRSLAQPRSGPPPRTSLVLPHLGPLSGPGAAGARAGGGWASVRGRAGAPGGGVRSGRAEAGAVWLPQTQQSPWGLEPRMGTLRPRASRHWNAGLTMSAGLEGLVLGRPAPPRPPPPLMAWITPPARRESAPGLRPQGTARPAPQAQHRGGHQVGWVSDLQGPRLSTPGG